VVPRWRGGPPPLFFRLGPLTEWVGCCHHTLMQYSRELVGGGAFPCTPSRAYHGGPPLFLHRGKTNKKPQYEQVVHTPHPPPCVERGGGLVGGPGGYHQPVVLSSGVGGATVGCNRTGGAFFFFWGGFLFPWWGELGRPPFFFFMPSQGVVSLGQITSHESWPGTVIFLFEKTAHDVRIVVAGFQDLPFQNTATRGLNREPFFFFFPQAPRSWTVLLTLSFPFAMRLDRWFYPCISTPRWGVGLGWCSVRGVRGVCFVPGRAGGWGSGGGGVFFWGGGFLTGHSPFCPSHPLLAGAGGHSFLYSSQKKCSVQWCAGGVFFFFVGFRFGRHTTPPTPPSEHMDHDPHDGDSPTA